MVCVCVRGVCVRGVCVRGVCDRGHTSCVRPATSSTWRGATSQLRSSPPSGAYLRSAANTCNTDHPLATTYCSPYDSKRSCCLLPTRVSLATYHLLPTTCDRPLATYNLLPTTCYLPLATYHLLPPTCYLPLATYHLLPAAFGPRTAVC